MRLFPLLLTSLFLLCLVPNQVLANGCTATGTPGCGGCTCEACVCGMDAYCCQTAWDDICVGECQDCGGCGGGGDPGGGACGSVTYEGCCSGQIVQYCEGGQLQQLDCSQNPSCGWSIQGGYYDCGTPGSGDPSGMNPLNCSGGGPAPVCGNGTCEAGESQATCPQDCGGGGGCGSVSYEGCCSGQVVQYCDGGQLQQLDCAENPSCGWSDQGGFYDCGTAGSADPSGMNPINCTGGTAPVCGNGYCEAGESQATCPQDCTGGGGPVCGNGACENGETAGTCPQDCVGGCTPDCTGKTCGPDGCNGSCGNCPPEHWCDIQGACQSMNGCTADCAGKSCDQDDGCGEVCGCPEGQSCAAGVCQLDGKPVPDVVQQGDGWEWQGDGECTPQCKTLGKACGSDGCGGSCGICDPGYGCNPQGLCEEGFVGQQDDSPYMCPEGTTLLYGKCVADGEGSDSGDGCSYSRTGSKPLMLLLLGMLLALVCVLRIPRRSEIT